MKERTTAWWVTAGLEAAVWLGYMGLIFFLSSRQSLPVFFNVTHIDKVYHTVAFMVLGAMGCQLGFRATNSVFWSIWWGGLTASLFGISDEWHQAFVPGRSSSLGDMVADFVGAWLGATLWGLWLGDLYRKFIPGEQT